MAKLAFLGLGVMGYPMAGHLQKAGHAVTVYNRTTAKAEKWAAEYGGSFATSPRAAAEGADVVLSCVGNDDDLRAVVLGADGALAGMAKGALYVDHTTVSAIVTRELGAAAAAVGVGWVDAPVSGGQAGAENGQLAIMCGGADGALAGMAKGALYVDHTTVSAIVTRELGAAAAAVGVGWVDAPVSGGQAGAENGQLAIMCGGADADFARAEAVVAAYSKATVHFGDLGNGQITKMINQVCIAGAIQAVSEGLFFAMQAGLDAKKVAALVSQGAGGSWQLANRAETMVDNKFNHGFAVDWMRKDLSIALGQAKELGISLPVTAMVDQYYGDVQALGGGRWDTSSLIQRFRKLHGLDI